MLKSLKIRNLATIEEIAIDFKSGFAVLTGETGAGKSIIIDAIRLILGEKSSPDLIRTGKKEASLEAVFDALTVPLQAEHIPPGDNGELFIQRYFTDQGSSRAYINGILVPARRLKEIADYLVDIYGQNDHVFLLQTENHRRFLDDFLETAGLLSDVAASAREIKNCLREKADLDALEREREQRLDFINFQIKEIENAGLKVGEDEHLEKQREIIRNAEKISSLAEKALDIAYLNEQSLISNLSKLKTLISDLAVFSQEIGTHVRGLDESAILVDELTKILFELRERILDDSLDSEAVEERLGLIEKLKRKYGPTILAIQKHLDEIRHEKSRLEKSSERLVELNQIIEKKYQEHLELAKRLSQERKAQASKLEVLIEKEISLLGMKKARFKIKVESMLPDRNKPETIREAGADDVEFLISPNPGEELRPLRRIASGGELSRIMLALKSIGHKKESGKTLIFDEIDSGIGGKTAEAIAQKLLSLASRHQVLCITHLPQIASAATAQYHVEKTVDKERTFTSVRLLSEKDRIREIARLISGSHMTEAALETSREMLARQQKKQA